MHLWGEWKSGVSCDGAAVRCPREWVGSPASGRLPHREPPPICRGRRGILMKVSVGLDLGAPNHLFLGLHKQAFSIVNIGYEVSNGKTIPTNWEQCVRTIFWRRLLLQNVHGRIDADHTHTMFGVRSKTRTYMIRTKVLTMWDTVLSRTVKISILLFWVSTSCGFVGRYQRFG
jgi:hypothetical protein